MQKLLTIKEASIWASGHLGKSVTPSNISYLIRYGRVGEDKLDGQTFVNKYELEKYYKQYSNNIKNKWDEKTNNNLNWDLSFSKFTEKETTKHVHRLHPYKGKFIPQLVEYFLDGHTDDYKKEVYFNKGDIILDPFCGSGTTLIQANELGIHALGVDISKFNAFISNVKVGDFNLAHARKVGNSLTKKLENFQKIENGIDFENELLNTLKKFNNNYFSPQEFRIKVKNREIDEALYGLQKSLKFRSIYKKLLKKYSIELEEKKFSNFNDKWFIAPVKKEIDFLFYEINKVKNCSTKKLFKLILSRTIRSCRATTHADLGTLKHPCLEPYYCKKHGKICRPLFSILKWWKRYLDDSINRIETFNLIKTNTFQECLIGESGKIDLLNPGRKSQFFQLFKEKKIAGIFTSPPYLGMINYHEQHAYAYDLFGLKRKDELEIGSLNKGKSLKAQKTYIKDVSDVLLNCKKYLKSDYNVFLVINDKNNLYPEIFNLSNMKIVNKFERPVLNRVEKDQNLFSETIFHLKEE